MQLAPAPGETPIPEPPWRMQEAEAKAPPMQEAPEETAIPVVPWKMQETAPAMQTVEDAAEPPLKTQKSEPKAPPTGEVRLFRYCVPHILKGAIIMCSG